MCEELLEVPPDWAVCGLGSVSVEHSQMNRRRTTLHSTVLVCALSRSKLRCTWVGRVPGAASASGRAGGGGVSCVGRWCGGVHGCVRAARGGTQGDLATAVVWFSWCGASPGRADVRGTLRRGGRAGDCAWGGALAARRAALPVWDVASAGRCARGSAWCTARPKSSPPQIGRAAGPAAVRPPLSCPTLLGHRTTRAPIRAVPPSHMSTRRGVVRENGPLAQTFELPDALAHALHVAASSRLARVRPPAKRTCRCEPVSGEPVSGEPMCN